MPRRRSPESGCCISSESGDRYCPAACVDAVRVVVRTCDAECDTPPLVSLAAFETSLGEEVEGGYVCESRLRLRELGEMPLGPPSPSAPPSGDMLSRSAHLVTPNTIARGTCDDAVIARRPRRWVMISSCCPRLGGHAVGRASCGVDSRPQRRPPGPQSAARGSR